MGILVDRKAETKCYAVRWSCGEICIGCNCCGRDSKGLEIWKARLEYHRDILKDQIQFKLQLNEVSDLFEYQAKIVKENIKFHQRKITICKRMIEKLNKNDSRF